MYTLNIEMQVLLFMTITYLHLLLLIPEDLNIFLLFLILITSANQILLWGSWFTRMSRSYLTFHLILMWLVYNDEDVLIILQMNYSLLKTTQSEYKQVVLSKECLWS